MHFINSWGDEWATSPEPDYKFPYWLLTTDGQYTEVLSQHEIECFWHYTNRSLNRWDGLFVGSHVTRQIYRTASDAITFTGVPQMPDKVCLVCAFKNANAFKPAAPPTVSPNYTRSPTVLGGADDWLTGKGATVIGCSPLK